MRLFKFFALLFTISLIVSQTSMSQTASGIPKQQIVLWDAVIAGNVTTANASIKAGADVNGLDTRANVAGPNGRRPLNYAANKKRYSNDYNLAQCRSKYKSGKSVWFYAIAPCGRGWFQRSSDSTHCQRGQSHAEKHA